jgi:Family of unknown function (DUF6949)
MLSGLAMVHNLLVFLFAMTCGFAVSGIVANLYRLLAGKPAGGGKATYYIVMIIAGPSVLFDNAARAWLDKNCTTLAFWLAAAISAYWSFIIGLFGMNIMLAF